jgi:VanZ family protein
MPTQQRVNFMARIIFWLTAAAVLYLALAPAPPQPALTGWDKANHVLAFAVLGTLGSLGWPRRLARVMYGLFAFGLLIEVLQAFTPDHQADWSDVAADLLGLCLAASIAAALRWWMRRREMLTQQRP